MVKIKASQELKEFLSSHEMPIKNIYTYKEIRPFLLKASPDILQGCDFVWPKVKTMKPSPVIEEYREKRRKREYQEMTRNLKTAQPEPAPEIKYGLGLGLSFISVLFIGMLSGYYLGKYIFGMGEFGSLILGLIMSVLGVYVEVFLYLLRSDNKYKKD